MAHFSSKQYFKKIHAHALLSELYKRNNILAIFEITEQTSRKNVIAILQDFYNSISLEEKIVIDEELEKSKALATPHGEYIIPLLLKEKNISSVTTVECVTKEDLSLYYYLFHPDVYEQALFIHSFFIKPSYMLYEAKEVPLTNASFALTELSKEWKRILEKEGDVLTFLDEQITHNNNLFYKMSVQGIGTNKRDDEIRLVYMGNQKEVLISYTGSKYEKLILLDTFLRVVCNDGYLERVESYTLTSFKNENFSFSSFLGGLPLMSWKIKSVTISFGSEKNKKKMKISLPNKQETQGLSPLFSLYKETGLEETAKLSQLDAVTLSLYFTNMKNKEKTVHVPVTITERKASLCPLYPYHAYVRTILKKASIYEGFVEPVKKEKDDMTKKWEA